MAILGVDIFVHECGLGSAQPCLVIFASKSPGGGEPACDRKSPCDEVSF